MGWESGSGLMPSMTQEIERELDSVGIPRLSVPGGLELPLWYRVALLRVRMQLAEDAILFRPSTKYYGNFWDNLRED
jgi:hypothetical protein